MIMVTPLMTEAQQGLSSQTALKRMDRNDDGMISKGEWKGAPPAFNKIDRNGDNQLNADELDAWFTKRNSSQSSTADKGLAAVPATRSGATPQAQTETDKPGLSWIDTHVHLRRGSGSYEGAARNAVALMETASIQTAILMPPPFPKAGRTGNRYDAAILKKLARTYPGRFVFLGGGDLINGIIESTPPDEVSESVKAEFTRRARDILDAGARGFGEMGMMHLGHFPGHPSYWVQPDHPLFLLLADIAGERNAVIDIHMDIVEEEAKTPRGLHGHNPPVMKKNLDAFERFVSHNRDARIVLAHAGWDVTGQWSPAVSRRLLSDHPNLYMSFKIGSSGGQRKNSLMKGVFSKSINSEWIEVIKEFPDRFVIGSDSFYAEAGARGKAPGGMTKFNGKSMVLFIDKLPSEISEKVASENAIAIYGID